MTRQDAMIATRFPAPIDGAWAGLIAFGLLVAIWPRPTYPADPSPGQLVRETAEAVLQEIRFRNDEFRREPELLYLMVEARLVPHFDMQYISQAVLGRHWAQAHQAQQERFTTAFQFMLVRQYAHALLEVQDERFEWLPVTFAGEGNDALVRSSLVRGDLPPVTVNYRLRRAGDSWLVYDISIEGVSLVTNYRGAFTNEIRKHGLDAVINRLEQRISAQ